MIEMCLVSLAACNTADSFLAQLLLTCLNKLMHKTKHDVVSFQNMAFIAVQYDDTQCFF